MSTPPIRLATSADAPACSDIYRPIVESTATSFEVVVPTSDDFAERIQSIMTVYPWLVFDEGFGASAYAYACQHRSRSAYQWSVEVSVYVHKSARRRGVARRLYETLFACLRHQGFRSAYAGITIPNDASVSFHRTMRFQIVGTFPAIGYKLGEWHDVLWLSLPLGDYDHPGEPLPLPACRDEIERVIHDAQQL